MMASFEVRFEEAKRGADARIRKRAAGRIPLGPYADGTVYAPADTSAAAVRELLTLYVRLVEARGEERAEALTALTRRGCTYSLRRPR